ncbi:MAG: hypothetical protein E6G31_10955 [Actinobacteria bacterium]|jgi:hypothetical protein|nr:MAG: hypothetical protein E6G31_10955 [Actinomycetota bacterium]
MDLGYGLTETVQFELPDLAGAARLATLLRSRWAVSVNEEDDVALVDVCIRPRTDLASLMRTVEGWVARESLRAIRFELDGRVYILEAGEVDWAYVPRPAVEAEAA